jgi:PAS domain S-box-containing protein
MGYHHAEEWSSTIMNGSFELLRSAGPAHRRKHKDSFGTPWPPAEELSLLTSAIDTMPVPSWETDTSGRFLAVNHAWRTLAGLGIGDTIEEGWGAGIIAEDRPRVTAAFLERHCANADFDCEFRIRRQDGALRWVRAVGGPIIDNVDSPPVYRGTLVDVTDQHEPAADKTPVIREKETLLKEIHHRVKNNMQIISSMLNLQEADVKDPYDQTLFRECQNRIRTMALVHEQLYRSQDLTAIAFGVYLHELASTLVTAYMGCDDRCRLELDVQSVSIDINKAIPAGLLVHEILSNAFCHAFPGGRNGTVRIRFHVDPAGTCLLSVSDDGIGFPGANDISTRETLGFRLITMLTEQLEGSLDVDNTRGSMFTVRFQI